MVFRAYFSVFHLKNAHYVWRAAVLLCSMGRQQIRDMILLCEYLDFSYEDFLEDAKNLSLHPRDVTKHSFTIYFMVIVPEND